MVELNADAFDFSLNLGRPRKPRPCGKASKGRRGRPSSSRRDGSKQRVTSRRRKAEATVKFAHLSEDDAFGEAELMASESLGFRWRSEPPVSLWNRMEASKAVLFTISSGVTFTDSGVFIVNRHRGSAGGLGTTLHLRFFRWARSVPCYFTAGPRAWDDSPGLAQYDIVYNDALILHGEAGLEVFSPKPSVEQGGVTGKADAHSSGVGASGQEPIRVRTCDCEPEIDEDSFEPLACTKSSHASAACIVTWCSRGVILGFTGHPSTWARPSFVHRLSDGTANDVCIQFARFGRCGRIAYFFYEEDLLAAWEPEPAEEANWVDPWDEPLPPPPHWHAYHVLALDENGTVVAKSPPLVCLGSCLKTAALSLDGTTFAVVCNRELYLLEAATLSEWVLALPPRELSKAYRYPGLYQMERRRWDPAGVAFVRSSAVMACIMNGASGATMYLVSRPTLPLWPQRRAGRAERLRLVCAMPSVSNLAPFPDCFAASPCGRWLVAGLERVDSCYWDSETRLMRWDVGALLQKARGRRWALVCARWLHARGRTVVLRRSQRHCTAATLENGFWRTSEVRRSQQRCTTLEKSLFALPDIVFRRILEFVE